MQLYRHSKGFNFASRSNSNPKVLRRRDLRGSLAASYDFPDFGNGSERNNHFTAFVEWEDVERLVAAFSDAGHPEAFKLLSDLKTLRKIREALTEEARLAGEAESFRDISNAL